MNIARACVAILLAGVVGCSSGGSGGSTSSTGGATSGSSGSTGSGARTLTPSTTTATQYRSVLLDDSQASFSQPSYAATLGSTSVTLTRVSPTRLGLFISPSFSTGATSLAVTAEGVTYPAVALQVNAVNVPADPVGYEASTVANMRSSLQTAQQTWASRADLQPIFTGALANVQAFDTSFQGWDATTQAQAAAYLAANDPLLPQGFFSDHPIATAWLKVSAEIVATAAFAAGGQPLLALAAGAKLAADAGALANLYGQATSDAVETVNASDSLGDVQLVQAVSFQNSQATSVPIFVNMKNLSRDDLNSTVPVVKESVDALRDLDADWSTINADVTTSLGNPPQLSDIATVTQEEAADAAVVHVANITSSDVTLASYVPSSGSASITFDAASCAGSTSAPVSFTFDLVYDDGTFPAVTATIPATLNCAAPTCGGPNQPCCASTGCNSITDSSCGTNYVDPLICVGSVEGSNICCLPTGTTVWTDLAFSACCTPPVDPRGGSTCTTAFTTCG